MWTFIFEILNNKKLLTNKLLNIRRLLKWTDLKKFWMSLVWPMYSLGWACLLICISSLGLIWKYRNLESLYISVLLSFWRCRWTGFHLISMILQKVRTLGFKGKIKIFIAHPHSQISWNIMLLCFREGFVTFKLGILFETQLGSRKGQV